MWDLRETRVEGLLELLEGKKQDASIITTVDNHCNALSHSAFE